MKINRKLFSLRMKKKKITDIYLGNFLNIFLKLKRIVSRDLFLCVYILIIKERVFNSVKPIRIYTLSIILSESF